MVNGNRVATFMCTPEDLKELAAGYLWGRGAISSVEEIYLLGACDDMRFITVSLSGDLPESFALEQVLSSACGSGGYIEDESLLKRRVSSTLTVSGPFLRSCFAEMFQRAVKYRDAGGIHSAALIDTSGVLDVKEDVGRHNAVDKVLGACLLSNRDPADCGLITTGRLSTDMVLKAIGAGVGVVATRSIPTSLALEIAEVAGLTLIGRGHREKTHVYCGSHRFVAEMDSQ